MGRYDEALANIRRATSLEPLNADLHFSRGVLQYKAGYKAASQLSFGKAAGLAPDSPRCRRPGAVRPSGR